MRLRLLDLLRCPDCKKNLQLIAFAAEADEITDGVLHCEDGHFFPIAGGIPRMLPDSFQDHWPAISARALKKDMLSARYIRAQDLTRCISFRLICKNRLLRLILLTSFIQPGFCITRRIPSGHFGC